MTQTERPRRPHKIRRGSAFWERVEEKPSGCWEWIGGRFANGYGNFQNKYAHRVALELSRGRPIPAGAWVLHRCDNPPCVRPEHLYLGDREKNTRDAVARGRLRFGENHHAAKLTEAQVVEIHWLRSTGLTVTEIARRYGVCRRTVRAILAGETWSRLRLLERPVQLSFLP